MLIISTLRRTCLNMCADRMQYFSCVKFEKTNKLDVHRIYFAKQLTLTFVIEFIVMKTFHFEAIFPQSYRLGKYNTI